MQDEIEQLVSKKSGLYNTYQEQKQRFKELQTVKRNIDQILRGRNPAAERSRAMSDNLPRMDYRQHRRARRLVHECCNYNEGNCLLLDDGEPCVCVQSISLSLMCRWFRVAVLPLDGELAAALLYRGSRKRCAVCGAAFVPKSNRGKYCPGCAGRMKKIKAAERKAETKAEMLRFRAFQTRINQGFFRGCQRVRDTFILFHRKRRPNAYKPPKSTRTQGGDPIADYIMADTKLPAYLPYPRFLLKMEISQTAKLLYAVLLDRSTFHRRTSGRTTRAGFILSIQSRR